MKESTSDRRRNRREVIILIVLVLCVHSSFKLLHWDSQDQSWWQVILVASLAADIYWALASSLRKFAEENATPKPQA